MGKGPSTVYHEHQYLASAEAGFLWGGSDSPFDEGSGPGEAHSFVMILSKAKCQPIATLYRVLSFCSINLVLGFRISIARICFGELRANHHRNFENLITHSKKAC
jgi:hypothetical protein